MRLEALNMQNLQAEKKPQHATKYTYNLFCFEYII